MKPHPEAVEKAADAIWAETYFGMRKCRELACAALLAAVEPKPLRQFLGTEYEYALIRLAPPEPRRKGGGK